MLSDNYVFLNFSLIAVIFNENSLDAEADSINPKYIFSGNPVTGEGWLNILEHDWRFLNSTGSFKLERGKPIELIYANIVGRGDSPLNSATVANISDVKKMILVK